MDVIKTIDSMVEVGLKEEIKEKLQRNKEESEYIQQAYRKNMDTLSRVLNKDVEDVGFLWNETAELYGKKIKKVKACLEQSGMNVYLGEKGNLQLDLFLKRCRDKDFQIALVGAIKAGKSSLINALLGMELASTNITPETASLTKFCNSPKGNYVKVLFYDDVEWDKLWNSVKETKAEVFLEEYEKLNAESEKGNWINHTPIQMQSDNMEAVREEIKKWTSSKSAVHYFVKEVVVGIENNPMLDEGIVLVDTPGLNDAVAYRSDITRNYIARANAVLVCVDAKRMTADELTTIYSVFANRRYSPEKVYVLATQVDTLNEPVEGWMEQKVEWIKHLKGKSAYGKQQLANKNLIGISSYIYSKLISDEFADIANLKECKDAAVRSVLVKLGIYELKKEDEEYNNVLEFCNIRKLQDKLKTEVIANYRELQVKDLQENYDACKLEISAALNTIKGQQVELANVVSEGIEELRKKRAECESTLEQAKAEKHKLDDLIKELNRLTQQKIEEVTGEISKLA